MPMQPGQGSREPPPRSTRNYYRFTGIYSGRRVASIPPAAMSRFALSTNRLACARLDAMNCPQNGTRSSIITLDCVGLLSSPSRWVTFHSFCLAWPQGPALLRVNSSTRGLLAYPCGDLCRQMHDLIRRGYACMHVCNTFFLRFQPPPHIWCSI